MSWRIFRSRRPADDMAAEVKAEIEAHLALRRDDNIAAGMDADDAAREAERRFGRVNAVAEESTRVRRRALSWRRALASDLRYAWIGLARTPRVFWSALLVALIGFATAGAAVRLIDALLVRAPAGIRQPHELWSILDSFNGKVPVMMQWRVAQAIEAAAPDLSPFAWGQREVQVIHDDHRRVWPATFVSGSYFRSLGTRPSAGRLLVAEDVAQGRPVVVIDETLAATLAANPSSLVGQALRLNGQTFEIAGITQAGFRGLETGRPTRLWLPITTEPLISTPRVLPNGEVRRGLLSDPGTGWLRGGIRVPASQSIDDVGARLTAIARSMPAISGTTDADRRILLADSVWLSPWPSAREDLRTLLRPIAWSVGFALLLTATCLGSLFVGRFSDRGNEFALRAALGAPRRRLLRLVALEIGLVAIVATVVSTPITAVLLQAAGRLRVTTGVVETAVPDFDVRAALQLATLAAITALAAMIAPAMTMAHATRSASMTTTRATPRAGWFRRILMTAQVAAGCGLLAAALLLTRTIDGLKSQPLGYDGAAVSFVTLDPAGAGLTDDERRAVTSRALELDGAIGAPVAIADWVPFALYNSLFVVAESSNEKRQYPLPTTRISGPYFETAGIRVVAGRTFSPTDAGRPVVILSESLARQYWPDENAVGHAVRVGGPNGTRYEVIGVVASVRDMSLRSADYGRIYLPYDDRAESLVIVARSPTGRAADVQPALLAAAAKLDSRLVTIETGSFSDRAMSTLEQRTLFRRLTTILGGGSLVMIAVGVWGLANGSLRRRWREFGIRHALGASRIAIGRLAMADAVFVAVAGGVLGLVAAWQFGRILSSMLFEITATDPVSFAIAVLAVAGAAFAGAVAPARKAARLDPAKLLRED
ncbi:MAG TPA: ABC transporter permease [Vicinamibacterales bacterium]|nr:ABC transporter permease [Vicinamibacterales bacterium]